jgi:hypothetical protein
MVALQSLPRPRGQPARLLRFSSELDAFLSQHGGIEAELAVSVVGHSVVLSGGLILNQDPRVGTTPIWPSGTNLT